MLYREQVSILPEGRSDRDSNGSTQEACAKRKECNKYEFTYLYEKRRSIRKYTEQPVSRNALNTILEAGLLSASGRARRPWEFVVVTDRNLLDQMAHCRDGAARMLCQASAAIVVVADPSLTDVWTEDCSVAMSNMHLMADSLNIGSCWIQGRLRTAEDGQTTEDFLRQLLHYPSDFRLEAILSLGTPAEHPSPHSVEEIPSGKIHWKQFCFHAAGHSLRCALLK